MISFQSLLIGMIVGIVILIVLEFFDIEILNAVSALRRKVRELCGLDQ